MRHFAIAIACTLISVGALAAGGEGARVEHVWRASHIPRAF